MRVLIADRNARLLESISRTFARQFAIRTATSCEQCNELLADEGEFDLVLISEKLSDGLGLQLLGQVARSSPDTLRVFAARRSRLQLLKGKLGPFGLFRTLSYPINPQELLSTLTLAQTGLAIGAPAPGTPDVQSQEEAPEPPPAAAAEMHPVVERISLTSSDAAFTIDVPKTILSQRKVRRSSSRPVPRPASVAQGAPAPATQASNVAPELLSNARQARKETLQQPDAVASQSQRSAPQQPPAAPRSQGAARQQPPAAPRSQGAARQQPPTAPRSARAQQHAVPHSTGSQAAPTYSPAAAHLPSQSRAPQHASRSRRAANRPVVSLAAAAHPTRSKIVLAATSVVVFVVTTLTLNMNDASVHVTRASTPRPQIKLPQQPEPPAALAPAFRPQPTVARRVEPKPDMDPVGQQVAANNPPTADPSTFGHEAYEVIYAN